MASRTKGLDEKIEKSAKEEFLMYGFKDASINRIAKNAGVTSGAIYIRYSDKDSIFISLVSEVLKGLEEKIEFYKGKYSKLATGQSWEQLFLIDEEVFNWMIEYMYGNFDVFKLLICFSDGSSVSNFADDLINFKFQRTYDFTESVCALIEKKYNKKVKMPIGKEELALLASAQYYSLFEIIRKGYSKNNAKKYLHTVQLIYINGLKTLLKEFFSEIGNGNEHP